MNWDRIAGNWKQLKAKVKQQGGKLTDDQVDVIASRRDQLVAAVQERYGIARDEAERQVKNWAIHCGQDFDQEVRHGKQTDKVGS